jgi:hypothetical protein
MKQLQTNGVWKIREDELSPAEFEQIDDTQKMTYLYQILLLETDMRSTYERVILSRYNNGCYSFILDETYAKDSSPVSIEIELTSTQIGEDTGHIPSVEELQNYGKKYLEKYLNAILNKENSRWKTELKFTTADNFIKNTRNYLEINNLTVMHIKAYKKIMLND